ncbi:hypothetical protein DHEL01_v211079 [Diaporthe helianthi]|uniref:Hydrophobin n=1 Tax=Diaporthe helianthi TaxID=158607 RepID=A0A2P5HJV6_DIAHE|nr:hypothetical protein DHEL01_v211079 [Diaporthe helianthi]
MKIPSFQVIVWVICAATTAAPIREQSPIGDLDLTRVVEESKDPELVEFASRVQTSMRASKALRVLGQGDGSCFCSGGSVCCRQGSDDIDCGFGLCAYGSEKDRASCPQRLSNSIYARTTLLPYNIPSRMKR